ncbi:cell division cycle protein 27 homolog, partial [Saccostrea cucullata]|uniref:cell division cycle protein 27 homolog n=1 Tax=Saccostrea cuccullata TaxID=36930 RepID=UPI002ED49D72
MLLLEPVKAAIWDSLNHYAYADAIFLAERLYAEVSNNEALYLLATCYYRAGQLMQTYGLLQKQGCPTPQCKYLMARCCMDVGKLSEAEEVLTGNIFSKSKSVEEIEAEFGSMSCHTLSILGAIFSKTERISKAVECYKKSLKLNPLLWSAFERLCSLGDKSDPSQVFQVPAQSQSTPVMQLTEVPSVVTMPTTVKAPNPILKVTEVLTPVSETSQACTEVDTNVLETPQPQPHTLSQVSVTPENFLEEAPANIFGCPRTKKKVKPRTENVLVSDQSVQKTLFHSPLTPSFGLLPITPSADRPCAELPFLTPSPPVNCQTDHQAPKKPVTRRTQNAPLIKPPVFNVNNGTNNTRELSTASNNNSREPAVG